MYKVGITGGIGSGKSTICRLFAERGVALYESDRRAKELMTSDEALREALVENFGVGCYDSEGLLQREYLASRVFGDEQALQRLNSIVHPAVRLDFRRWAAKQHSPYVILESAILFDAKFESEVDTTLAVLAPLELRIQRTIERDGVSREAVLDRIAHQLGDDELHALADRTLVNISLDYISSDIEQLHKVYCYEAQR